MIRVNSEMENKSYASVKKPLRAAEQGTASAGSPGGALAVPLQRSAAPQQAARDAHPRHEHRLRPGTRSRVASAPQCALV